MGGSVLCDQLRNNGFQTSISLLKTSVAGQALGANRDEDEHGRAPSPPGDQCVCCVCVLCVCVLCVCVVYVCVVCVVCVYCV